MKLNELTAHELQGMLRKREVSAEEIAKATFERIDAVEDTVKAYVSQTREMALEQARNVDKKIAAGEKIEPLAGIPIALKDNLCKTGVRCTCSSKMLENWVPAYNATVVEKLSDQGAVFVGKANLDEFAMGSSTENSAFFTTRNPWNPDHVPGGSSGGSAAATAADECIMSLGSDTGGSIRQPSCFCGVVGFKPTYGRVSRYGVVAFASSLDQIGPITKDVTDSALLLQAISGQDSHDTTSAPVPVPDYTKALRADVKGLRIGIPREFYGKGVIPEIRETLEKAIKTLTDLGAVAEEISMPHIEYTFPVYYILAPCEASSNLARFDGVRYGYRAEGDFEDFADLYDATRGEGFGPEVKQRIMLGTFALSAGYYDAFYSKALKVRTLVKQDFDKAFEKFDVLATPVSPVPPFKVGEVSSDPLQMKLADVCTIPINLAGIPGMSVPCGFAKGLPVGMQLLAKPFAEETILRTAYTYEQATEWHKKKPALGR